jgi:hypothetical protein
MGYKLRQFTTEDKFSQALTLDALDHAIRLEDIKAVLQAEGVQAQRERKLNMVVIVLVVLAMNLYTHLSLRHVMQKIAQGLRFVWPDPTYPLPKASALTYRRYQLGVRPLAALFHRVCRPLASPQTPGAFLFGRRLMAIDSTVEDLPDTPDNVAVFGRYLSARGPSAFAQARAVYLAECGTHAIVDAGFWPGRTSERIGGFRVLRSVTPEMLVLWDRGFHDYDMFTGVLQRGGHVLSRLPAHVKPKRVEPLPDGSTLAYIYPSEAARRKRGEHLVVRVVDYTLTEPALPGYDTPHHLITTLLDPSGAPALELVCAYHERWEIELLIDEADTHQRLAGRPLRSRKPLGVMQELFALVIAHYALRFLMHEAAVDHGLDPDRLSFVHALRVVQEAIPEFQMVAPDHWPQLYRRLLHDLAEGPRTKRRHRSNPRVVRRKMSKFHLKRPEHYGWPQPTQPFCEAVAFI